MFDIITKFFKKFSKNENKDSKDTAKERLHLVLMQDRANVSADFLELMKQEIIEVIKKYVDVDENSIDVKLTNKDNGDGTTGAPALYANIPIITIKENAKQIKIERKENKENKDNKEKTANEEKKDNKIKVKEEKTNFTDKEEEKVEVEVKKEENKKDNKKDNKKEKDTEDVKKEKNEEVKEDKEKKATDIKEKVEENKKEENKETKKEENKNKENTNKTEVK